MLRLDSDWLWDSWIADDGDRFHLFFLKAPRSLGDHLLRHERATVGHATSSDLESWEYVGEAFAPSATGWDDLSIWTGSTVRGDDGLWYLFYTALSTRRGHGAKDQKIGLATSADLYTWTREGETPLLTADRRWYKTLDDDPDASETWRDPFVFRDPDGDGWHMFITARALHANRYDDGVVGHAHSPDLRNWTIGPPLSQPGAGFGQLEVQQLGVVRGRPVLVFTCHPDELSDARRAMSGEYCAWSVPGASVTGPWDLGRAEPFRKEPLLFAARLVQRRDGSWVLLGFRNTEPDGPVALELIDPVPVDLVDGALQACE